MGERVGRLKVYWTDKSQRVTLAMLSRLIAVSGRLKGSLWDLNEPGITIGRDRECGVVLLEAIVSRKHCRVTARDGSVFLEDLGSRNPALVNGVPVRHAQMRPGDMLSVGTNQFLLACDSAEAMQSRPGSGPRDTLSWSDSEPVCLRTDHARDGIPDRPGTVQDLVFLYEITRELSGCESVQSLLELLHRRLQERFDPAALWMALVHGSDELHFYEPEDSDGSLPEPPVALIRACLEDRCGQLVPGHIDRDGEKVHTITMAVPVTMSGMNLGALALRSEIPRAVYDEEDLRLLLLLSQTLAPVLCAVRNLEQLRRDNERLRARAGESMVLLGESRAIRRVRTQIIQAARASLTVLITGETGTGKELAARSVHAESTLRNEAFIIVNCAAIPRELFESEFFGYDRGAFTGATQGRHGMLEQANGGVLFLDEVGDLSLDNQSRILRAVETGAFRRVGGAKESQVNVRIVSATNRDLLTAIAQGSFREDLYHRINGIGIHIPPLRERPSDIHLLADHFFNLARGHAKRPLTQLNPQVYQRLDAYNWPGNVRELRNCIYRAVNIARGDVITPQEIADALGTSLGTVGTGELSLAEVERLHIKKVLRNCDGSIKEAARLLGISRSTLYVKMAEYNVR